jgi:hypothetical protein
MRHAGVLAAGLALLASAAQAAERHHRPGDAHGAQAIALTQAASSPQQPPRAFRWQPFQSRDGGFSVQFPGKPEVSRRTIRTDAGDVISVRHTAGDGAHATYDVTINDYPRDSVGRLTPGRMIDAARDGLVFQSKGRLVSQKAAAVGKVQGRDHEIEGADGMRYHVRLLAVGSRVYQITAMAQPPAQPETQRFFDSFRLTGIR